MNQLSNGFGVVAVEGAEAIGYRQGQEFFRLPLPLSFADAEAIIRLCLDKNEDLPLGLTAEMFIKQDLTMPGKEEVLAP